MADFKKYARQTALDGFGAEGQNRLLRASVALIGAGGVGSAVLPLLAGAGIGRIVIADADVVSETNLHRQTLYRAECAGKPKAELAKNFASSLNPDVKVEFFAEKLSAETALCILKNCDLCIDATDSFSSRIAVSDACKAAGIPEIYASAEGFVSQNVYFGGDFYIDGLVRRADMQLPPGGRPIFSAAAHLSGVWAASAAIKKIALGVWNEGLFMSFDHLKNRYFSAKIS